MSTFFESKPITYLGKLVDLVVINVVFVISCIPVVTIGAALTALYYTCVKAVRMDCGKLLQEYKKSFRLNFKTATGVWFLLAGLLALFSGVAYLLITRAKGTIFVLGVGLCMAWLLFLIAIVVYAFPVLSRFTVDWKGLLKSAVVMSITHGSKTIYMLVMTLGMLTLFTLEWKYVPLLLLTVPGIYMLLLSLIMEKVLSGYIVDVERAEGEKKNQESLAEDEEIRTVDESEQSGAFDEAREAGKKEETDKIEKIAKQEASASGKKEAVKENDGDIEQEKIFFEQTKEIPWYLEGGQKDE